ncbi:MAG: SpaA isopeptide-forming pilin-related protein, partial [Oribacterium sp.]|nr:SpaA isopeptide-forming pilin-related protein [Oribacterium sp.]
MKLKTKTMTRWLAMVLCVITLFTLLMPAVNAAETDVGTPDESAEVVPEVEAAEEASPIPDSTDDENGFTISPVVAALSNASAVGNMSCWEDTDYNVVERNASVKLRSSGATVMSVPAGESIYLQRGGYVSYGNYVTDFYSVWMGESALAHEGDKNYACAAFCACPSMSGPNTGHYSGASVQRMNSDADTNYTTLSVFKAVILTSPYGPLAEYHQSFWNVIEPDLAATDKMFATVHAILGYLYDPGSHGTPYRWDAAMQSTILGSGGLLEQIINWANANPDALSQVYVYRLKGSDSGLQDLVWMNAVPKYPMYLKKVSSNPTLTDNNSKYSLGGAVYTVYSDAACTKSVGTLTTGDNGVSGYLYVKEGTYYAMETTAPKGFELNPDVIGPVSVSASNQPGIFNATDIPKPTSGSGKLVKQSANPDITNGNSYYTLGGAEYAVYSDQALTKSVGVLKTDKNGTSNTLSLDAGTYYVKETKAPNGFKLDSTVHSMAIKENETTTLTVKDSYVPSSVTLKKVSSSNGVDGNENYSLAGAVYDVFSDKDLKNKVGSLTTKADGTTNSITVPAGTYYAKE